MIRKIHFDRWWGDFWPPLDELRPFFLAPKGKEWSYSGGNDNWGISLHGVDGTEDKAFGRGQKCINLSMWGNPEHGVLLMYEKIGAGDYFDTYFSKGDMTRLNELVETLHQDLRPVGLYIPFATAWLAVKDFMETEGQLPKSIDWVHYTELPRNTFPSP